MNGKELIYKDDARKAVLKANPNIAYCIDNIKSVNKKVYTLYEIATEICCKTPCCEDCVGKDYCGEYRKTRNGIEVWLKKMMEEEIEDEE